MTGSDGWSVSDVGGPGVRACLSPPTFTVGAVSVVRLVDGATRSPESALPLVAWPGVADTWRPLAAGSGEAIVLRCKINAAVVH